MHVVNAWPRRRTGWSGFGLDGPGGVGATDKVQWISKLFRVVGQPQRGSGDQHGGKQDPRAHHRVSPAPAVVDEHRPGGEQPGDSGVHPSVIAGENGADQYQPGSQQRSGRWAIVGTGRSVRRPRSSPPKREARSWPWWTCTAGRDSTRKRPRRPWPRAWKATCEPGGRCRHNPERNWVWKRRRRPGRFATTPCSSQKAAEECGAGVTRQSLAGESRGSGNRRPGGQCGDALRRRRKAEACGDGRTRRGTPGRSPGPPRPPAEFPAGSPPAPFSPQSR